jgi:hypothetical protein
MPDSHGGITVNSLKMKQLSVTCSRKSNIQKSLQLVNRPEHSYRLQNRESKTDQKKLAEKNCKCNKSSRFWKMKMFAAADPPMPNLQKN